MKLKCKRCGEEFENKDKRVKYCLVHRLTINKSEFLLKLEQREERFLRRIGLWNIK